MLPLCKHPYIKVSTSDENSEEDGDVVALASYPPSPLKPLCYILGSILVWIALLILSACVSYKLAASNKLQMILSINNFDEVPTAESPYETGQAVIYPDGQPRRSTSVSPIDKRYALLT
jgi:hypothetical protein